MAEDRTVLPWQAIALVSGVFAALNGVFAKLTTAHTTEELATWITQSLPVGELSIPGLGAVNDWGAIVEGVLRIAVLISSFLVSGFMWALYTNALRRSPSAIQCNVLNTSANFVCAALAGNAIFGESLPGLWWVGAALLIAGTVIIGKRTTEMDARDVSDEKKKD